MPDEITQKVYTGVAIVVAVLILAAAIIGVNILRSNFSQADNAWLCQDGQWIARGNPKVPMPTTECRPANTPVDTVEYQGPITGLNNNQVTIRVSTDKEITFTLGNNSQIYDVSGRPADFSYLKKGFIAIINGAVESNNLYLARRIKVLSEPNIIVFSPQSGEIIGRPVIITGVARVFENTFNYRVKDSQGRVLAEKTAQTDAKDAGFYGNFNITADYSAPATEAGYVEVFDYSAKDGAEIDMVSVPVKFGKTESMNVTVYLGNSIKNPNAADCSLAYPVVRQIIKTQTPARAALEELLAGPKPDEEKAGYYTSLNSGIVIQKLTIVNGQAAVDFNKRLEEGVGGSCKVAAIRAQIIDTLKQFPTVKNVVISIDGRTEDILQP